LRFELTIAGFGGQGVLLMGRLVAYSAMLEGKQVTFMSSYGSEMRGGTANCTVVISDKEIFSPIVDTPEVIVALNKPSLIRFEQKVKKYGLLLLNSSLVDIVPQRKDISVIRVPATEMAKEVGGEVVANMVVLGVLTQRYKNIFSKSAISDSLKDVLPEHRQKWLKFNLKALQSGIDHYEQIEQSEKGCV
jgi:2-oxoglutarate ferredoxin oxidoreductase subunit gamma